jgi:site-specific recombinase XerD
MTDLVRVGSTIPRLSDVPDGVRRKATMKAVENRLVAEADRELTAATTDYARLVDEFLRTRRSSETRRRYRSAISRWNTWCADVAGVHPLLATPKDADLWAAQLTGAPASVNSAISAVSSFYSTLVKWEKLARTPFIRVARRADRATTKHVPTAAEVRAILEACG